MGAFHSINALGRNDHRLYVGCIEAIPIAVHKHLYTYPHTHYEEHNKTQIQILFAIQAAPLDSERAQAKLFSDSIFRRITESFFVYNSFFVPHRMHTIHNYKFKHH